MKQDSSTAWKVTDGEQDVTVHAGKKQPTPTRTLNAENIEFSHHGTSLPAAIGIGLVLLFFGWYWGLGELLTGLLVQEEAHVIVITEDGAFEPTSLELAIGDTLTIKNEHPHPQVLKSQNGRSLFETQVLFDEPFTFTVPESARGPYAYISETLPDTSVLTITVSLPAETPASPTTSQSPENDIPIPIPFDSTRLITEEDKPRPEPTVVVHDSGPATISLNTQTNTHASSQAATATLPTNPYTVHATGADQYLAQTEAVTSAGDNLHSGAPLQQYAQYRPPSTTGTGPTHVSILVLLISGLLFAPLARKMM